MEDLVFVSLFFYYGESDKLIDAWVILRRSIWEDEVAKFQTHLAKTGLSEFSFEDYDDWECSVSLENYKVRPITHEEAEAVRKFFLAEESSRGFRKPTDFIQYWGHREIRKTPTSPSPLPLP
jgi:hypothetical protein